MATPIRSSGTSEGARSENNSQDPVNPQQHVLDVAPLNSMHYVDPPSDVNSSPTKGETEAIESVGPAMIFLPSHSTQEEWEKLKDSNLSGVALTGSAVFWHMESIMGLKHIAESEGSYYFRVDLIGVANNEKEFSCKVEPDGKVFIKGVKTTGEKTVCVDNQIFTMLTQNLGPPGPFAISFQLPGPVDDHSFSRKFNDGVLKGVVKKK